MINAWSHYLSAQMVAKFSSQPLSNNRIHYLFQLPLFFSGAMDPDDAPVHTTLMNGKGVYHASAPSPEEIKFLGAPPVPQESLGYAGGSFEVIKIERGETMRLRFINTSPESIYV